MTRGMFIQYRTTKTFGAFVLLIRSIGKKKPMIAEGSRKLAAALPAFNLCFIMFKDILQLCRNTLATGEACSESSFNTSDPRRPCKKKLAKPNFPRSTRQSWCASKPVSKHALIKVTKSLIRDSMFLIINIRSPEKDRSKASSKALHAVSKSVRLFPD